MAAYVPPGWPSGVHPPGSEDFERTAQAWLLDVVPPDYRLHGVLRRYPLALAAMAAHHAEACVAGAREGYRNARTEVGGALPPHALEALLAAYRAEGRRLVATAQAVGLVARALRGEVFTPQLEDTAQHGTGRPAAGAEVERQAAQRLLPEQPAAESHAAEEGNSPAENMLRLPASLVDELLRLVGETMIANTQIKEQLRLSVEHTRAVTKQNTALQELAGELEQLVDVRGVTAPLGAAKRQGDFDALHG